MANCPFHNVLPTKKDLSCHLVPHFFEIEFSEARDYTIDVGDKSIRTIETRLLLDSRLQSLEYTR